MEIEAQLYESPVYQTHLSSPWYFYVSWFPCGALLPLGTLRIPLCSGWIRSEWNFLFSLGSGDWIEAPGSFLFSFVNPSGLPPTKLPLKPGQERYAIYCRSDCGPIFGRGHDLTIVSEPNISKGCWASLNNSYQCPFGQIGTTFLTGNKYFTVCEMEVFVIEE